MNKDIKELYRNNVLDLYTDEKFLSEYECVTFMFNKLTRYVDNDIQIILYHPAEPLVFNIVMRDIVKFETYFEPTEFYLRLNSVVFNQIIDTLHENDINIISFKK